MNVDAGKAVRWQNDRYRVYCDCLGQYLITFQSNGSTVGLTNKAGELTDKSESFYIAGEAELWENSYWCACGEKWQAELDSQCDDRCPKCDAANEPMFSSLVIR